MSTWTPAPDVAPRPSPIDTTPARWAHHRARIQLLDGTWRAQLAEALVQMIGIERASGWGRPSVARNLYSEVCEQLAVLYQEPFEIQNSTAGAALELDAYVTAAELQQVLGEAQLYTVGLGTSYVRIDTAGDGLRYERVSPDLVEDEPPISGGRQPDWIREYRLRPTGWEADEYDLSNPDNPVFRVWTCIGNKWSVQSEATGEAYPTALRDATGRAIHPYVLYRSAPARDGLHAPLTRESLRAGALDVAVLYCMVMHVFRDASWPQRWALGARPYGGGTASDTSPTTPEELVPRHEVVTDPAVVLLLERLADYDGQPMIGQWQPGGDAKSLYEVLDQISAQVAVGAGLSPTDLQRTAPNRSGAAIALSNEGKREAQRRFMPLARPSDELLLAKTAILLNRAYPDLGLPESGYKVAYRQLSLSVEELAERRKHAIEMVAAGLWSTAEAYAYLHPGIQPAEAERRVAAIAASKAPASLAMDPTGDTGPPPIVEKVADTALNGAQVTAAQGIVAAVAAGQLPRATGVAMLVEFFQVAPDRADRIFGTVGNSFQPLESDT